MIVLQFSRISSAPNVRLTRARFAGVALQAAVKEHHLSGATITPRKPALSIAALTRPSDFTSSMNLRAANSFPRSNPTLHLTRRGVPYYVVGTAKLEPNAK